MTIEETQFDSITKLKEKYLGPYAITAAKNHYRYEVEKISYKEGPGKTLIIAE